MVRYAAGQELVRCEAKTLATVPPPTSPRTGIVRRYQGDGECPRRDVKGLERSATGAKEVRGAEVRRSGTGPFPDTVHVRRLEV